MLLHRSAMDERIIEFVRDNPCIYDKKHGGYKNQLHKDRLWLQFSKEANIPVDVLKKKWKCIRDRFYRVHKKKSTEAASGSGQLSPDTKLYKNYDSLLFLLDVDSSNTSTIGNFLTEEEIPFDDEASSSFMNISGFNSSSPATAVPRKSKSNAVECELLTAMKSVRASVERKSAFRIFLDSIALTVEEAQLDVSQISQLQMGILQLVQSEINI
ncbi:uncharacterized protein LOC118741670 isoform X1 [Rhagoletis pomonella]|uniref:uncharacterized protein LOC118741670 isoform X1 n=2 Tax=Rhagoletis pomonella TaxID=28610 RepID=UPI00177D682C|nr:uncharacterized protein LOC118741670 isoform X1 [Rhagoletis pomonella]